MGQLRVNFCPKITSKEIEDLLSLSFTGLSKNGIILENEVLHTSISKIAERDPTRDG